MVAAISSNMPIRDGREQRTLTWFALALVIAAAVLLWPFAPWVILAVWGAAGARRIHRPLTRCLGHRPRIAAALTIGIGVVLAVPIGVVLTLLMANAIDLVHKLVASDRMQETLRHLVSTDDTQPPSSSDLMGLVMSQGGRAWEITQQVVGTAARGVIGLVILIAGTYAMLVDGDRLYAWIEQHAPISAPALRRFANAFTETGRGLLVGIVGAGLAQAVVATIIFVLIGVPQPFALGLLTFLLSVVPAVGTSIVWLPVAAGLALTGRTGAAMVLAIAGVAVIGTIDNLVRPVLTRRGHLQLPTFVVLVAMFSGVMTMGPWGLLIAPLVVRLAKEALSILRDKRNDGALVPSVHREEFGESPAA
ncbi:MAG: AI-2E family transporter [Kofleriaceae bacterium]